MAARFIEHSGRPYMIVGPAAFAIVGVCCAMVGARIPDRTFAVLFVGIIVLGALGLSCLRSGS
jgi:hypothetical protein